MHRALLIPEILHAVCVYATDATLVSLVRTCKVFHEVAIQVLWDELHDLSPLIKCFPEDAWTVDQEHVRIVRCLSQDDWANFLKYSSHVRHLGKWWTPSKQKCLALGHGAISSLSIYRPILVLFPRLVKLSWKDSAWPKDDRGLLTLLNMVGPRLKRIAIMDWSLQDDDGSGRRLQTSLSLISTRFPSLESFYLHCKQTPLVCKPIPGALPSSINSLRYFMCSQIPISENAFFAFGRLRHLDRLSIRLPALLTSAPLPPNAFPVLRFIEITTLTRDYLALRGDMVRFPLVMDVIIYLRDVPTVRDGLPFFDLISRQFSHVVLAGLSVYMDRDALNLSTSQQNKLTITPDNLRPLLSFTNLVDMSINIACPYALGGDFCSEIAQAFPEIEGLSLGIPDYCYHEPSTLPLMTQVLAPLATSCPKLFSIAIPFDARQTLTVDDVRDAVPQRPSRSAVISLQTTHCPIDDAHVVAAYLARVFPKLEGHRGIDWQVLEPTHPLFARWKDWEHVWTKVDEKLPWFAMIRDDERAATEEE